MATPLLMRYLFSRWERSSGRVSVGEPTAALAEEHGVRLRIARRGGRQGGASTAQG